jgi:hypothetical protein
MSFLKIFNIKIIYIQILCDASYAAVIINVVRRENPLHMKNWKNSTCIFRSKRNLYIRQRVLIKAERPTWTHLNGICLIKIEQYNHKATHWLSERVHKLYNFLCSRTGPVYIVYASFGPYFTKKEWLNIFLFLLTWVLWNLIGNIKLLITEIKIIFPELKSRSYLMSTYNKCKVVPVFN